MVPTSEWAFDLLEWKSEETQAGADACYSALSLHSNSTYTVEIVKDTVALSGMQAPGVGIGKADSDVMIEKELSE